MCPTSGHVCEFVCATLTFYICVCVCAFLHAAVLACCQSALMLMQSTQRSRIYVCPCTKPNLMQYDFHSYPSMQHLVGFGHLMRQPHALEYW